MATFLAFNLDDFHKQNGPQTTVQVRFIGSKNLEKAKELMATYYGETPWAVVPKKVFDKGIVLRREA